MRTLRTGRTEHYLALITAVRPKLMGVEHTVGHRRPDDLLPRPRTTRVAFRRRREPVAKGSIPGHGNAVSLPDPRHAVVGAPRPLSIPDVAGGHRPPVVPYLDPCQSRPAPAVNRFLYNMHYISVGCTDGSRGLRSRGDDPGTPVVGHWLRAGAVGSVHGPGRTRTGDACGGGTSDHATATCARGPTRRRASDRCHSSVGVPPRSPSSSNSFARR